MTAKTKSHYWAVVSRKKMREDEILFSGTFEECWDHLVKNFSEVPLKQFAATKDLPFGIKIARIK